MNEIMRCGYVALIGAPNAGKSTLVNQLVGSKVTIVSPKPQTTRSRVLGIAIKDEAQIVLVDTPGIFAPRKRLDRAMVAAAWGGADDADLLVLLVDAQRCRKNIDSETQAILDKLAGQKRRAMLILNKVDLVEKTVLLKLAERLSETGLFDEIFMVSALSGDGTDGLLDSFAKHMPLGHWLFPEDQLSDMPMRLLAAEVTREKLFIQLHQELPYAAAVETETWEERKDGGVRIEQAITVERESQKAIVVGKGGARIKAIGAAAREELTAMLERPVHLFLFVRVRENWQEDRERYRDIGLDFDS
jgi:GTP-binding protein Era